MTTVRLFVSYSRGDRAYVTGLVDELERRGHQVWVDTDDIRGSEPWRRSIAEGIVGAEAVVLVVSPASMASENVEREVTVAAENDRRIVPAVLRPAPLPPGLQYVLAGVQHVLLADLPVGEAVDRLEQAMTEEPAASTWAAPSAPPPVGDRVPARGRARSVRPYLAGAVLVVAAALVVWAIAGRGGDGETSTTTPPPVVTASATSPDVSTPEATLPAGAQQVALDATVWFAGFQVHATEARYDPSTGDVAVDVEITNTAGETAQIIDILVGSESAVEAAGARLNLYCTACSTIPPSATVLDTLTADTAGGFTLDGSALVFGQPLEHQAIVPLDGGEAIGDVPEVRSASGVVDDGQAAVFAAEEVGIAPAACRAFTEAVGFEPGDRDNVAVVVTGQLSSRGDARYNVGTATLTLPDGRSFGPASLTENMVALEAGVAPRPLSVCFDVPAPAEGEYGFSIKATGVPELPPPLVFTL
jgi:TIR domain